MSILKLTVSISLFACTVSGGVRNLIVGSVRPYPRSMIESISPNSPESFTDKSSVCQPSQDLSSPNFFGRQKEYTLHALSDSRSYLQGLEYESRKDDMRRSYQMRQAWIDSIWKELGTIKSRLVTRNLETAPIREAVSKLKKSAAESTPRPNPVLDITVSAKGELMNFKPEGEMSEPVRAAQNDVPTKWNTPQGWADLNQHHSATHDSVASIIDAIKDIGMESFSIFNEHNRFVSTDSHYQLKWPSFLSQEILNKLGEDFLPSDLVAEKGREKDYNFASLNAKLDSILGKSATSSETESSGIGSVDSFLTANLESELKKISALVTTTPIAATPSEPSTPATLSFSQRMSVLNAKLNWLNSLRLGNEDAQNSLLDLINRIKAPIKSHVGKISDSLTQIRTGLTSIDDSVWGVYRDAHGFTAEESPQLSQNFDEAISHLSKAISLNNNHASLPGRTKYIVDTVKMMHASLIALVDAHGDSPVYGGPATDASKLILIKTKLLTILPVAGSGPLDNIPEAFKGTLGQPDDLKRQISDLAEKADKTSKCILYGDVDGAQIFDKLKSRENVCAEAHAYGNDVLEKKMKEFESSKGSAATVVKTSEVTVSPPNPDQSSV